MVGTAIRVCGKKRKCTHAEPRPYMVYMSGYQYTAHGAVTSFVPLRSHLDSYRPPHLLLKVVELFQLHCYNMLSRTEGSSQYQDPGHPG